MLGPGGSGGRGREEGHGQVGPWFCIIGIPILAVNALCEGCGWGPIPCAGLATRAKPFPHVAGLGQLGGPYGNTVAGCHGVRLECGCLARWCVWLAAADLGRQCRDCRKARRGLCPCPWAKGFDKKGMA